VVVQGNTDATRRRELFVSLMQDYTADLHRARPHMVDRARKCLTVPPETQPLPAVTQLSPAELRAVERLQQVQSDLGRGSAQSARSGAHAPSSHSHAPAPHRRAV
jgi:hypothetical protein